MQIIQNNPYRQLGLLVGTTARQFQNHIKKIPFYIDADQEIPTELIENGFTTLGEIRRTNHSISEAASKLNLDIDKMNAALFWFFKGNVITDGPAFDAIIEGDLDEVLNIWSKLTSNGEVSQRNASAFSNLGTLYLSGVLDGTNTSEALLTQGISLKLKFLESNFIQDFKALATDETYHTNKKELQLMFLHQVQAEIEKSRVVTSNKLLDILTKQEFSAKEDFLKGYVQKPIEQIEKKIDEAKNKRKANKANAVNVGKALYEQTSENIRQVKSILGASNIKFSSISDKVSDEVLQCGIDYFSHFKDSSTDPGSASMDLFRKAKTLAVGNIAKQRCQENTENLQEWIDDKPERDKQKLIGEDLIFIASKLERFENLLDTVSNAKDLVDTCKPRLSSIKNTLGSSDDFYLKLSSAVANNALGMLVTSVNEAQESREVRLGDFSSLRLTVRSALAVSESIGTFDMSFQHKLHYSKNHAALKSIASQLNVNGSLPSSSSSRGSTTPGSSNQEGIPDWLKVVLGIIALIILIKACNS